MRRKYQDTNIKTMSKTKVLILDTFYLILISVFLLDTKFFDSNFRYRILCGFY